MLIVEDERDVSECLEAFFARRGFVVRCAFSGEEALELLEADAADVVLLDILLPGLSGLEVLRRAIDVCPLTKFVMVSAVDEPRVRTEARQYGAAAFIPKPFDFSDTTWSCVLRLRTT
jgi:DNA-binding response OmpR family regulator